MTQKPSPQHYRGTNFLPSTTVGLSSPLGMVPWFRSPCPGYYSPEHARDEVREIARAGFNNIRLHTPSLLGWMIDRAGYLWALRNLAGHCVQHGVVITYQLWTTVCSNHACERENFLLDVWNQPKEAIWEAVRDIETLSQSLEFPDGEPGQFTKFAEPGPAIAVRWPDVPTGLADVVRDYLRDIGQFFASDNLGKRAFGSYDLFNEADTIPDPLLPGIYNLIEETWQTLADAHREQGESAQFTIGFARAQSIEPWADATLGRVEQTYFSYHTDLSRVEEDLPLADRLARRSGVPHVVSEFWHTVPGQSQEGKLRRLVDQLVRWRAGGQMWGFLQSNVFFDRRTIDGVLVPQLPTTLIDPVRFEVGSPIDLAAVRYWTRLPFFDRIGGSTPPDDSGIGETLEPQ